MRRDFLIILTLVMLFCRLPAWGQASPPVNGRERMHNAHIRLCDEAVDFYNKGFYKLAIKKFEECTTYCETCKNTFASKINDCKRQIDKNIQTAKILPSGKENETRYVRMPPIAVISDSMEEKPTSHIVQADSVAEGTLEAFPEQGYEHQWISGNMTRTDTLIITDNSHFVHPYFIKSWRMDKKTWRWTFNSIGVASVAGSVALGILADRSYDRHAANEALTRREHDQYYRDYKLYSGLMGGCIVLAVATLSANFLAIQVRNEVKVVPGVWVDRQGNVQVALNVKF